MKETPIANYRNGDSEEWLAVLKEKGCDTKAHGAGYRSVHYLIQSQPTKVPSTVEVQVRTIFEEGWSEVDHRIRYPDDLDNPVLAPLLFIFNRFAGSADELASYIRDLKIRTDESERMHREILTERDQKVAELQAKIDALEIEPEAKKELKEEIETINTYDPAPPSRTYPPSSLSPALSAALLGFGPARSVLSNAGLGSGVTGLLRSRIGLAGLSPELSSALIGLGPAKSLLSSAELGRADILSPSLSGLGSLGIFPLLRTQLGVGDALLPFSSIANTESPSINVQGDVSGPMIDDESTSQNENSAICDPKNNGEEKTNSS